MRITTKSVHDMEDDFELRCAELVALVQSLRAELTHILRAVLDLVHMGPDEFETVLKFVRLQLFTRNRTNYRPKSVHTEPDEFVPEITY